MMMKKITRDQAQQLAALACALRRAAGIDPEWDQQGTFVAIGNAQDRGDAFEVTDATLKAARDPRNRTPAVIAMAGPHWTTTSTPQARHEDRCPVPGHEHCSALYCPLCRGSWLGGDGWPEGTQHIDATRHTPTSATTELDPQRRAANDLADR